MSSLLFARIRRLVSCAALVLAAPLAAGQVAAHDELTQVVNDAFDLDRSTLFSLEFAGAPGQPLLVSVPIDGRDVVLDLKPHSVRSSKYRVLAQIADGSMVEHAPSPVRTMRGTALGLDGSLVAGTFDDEGAFHARIMLPDTGEEYWVEQVATRMPGVDGRTHVVYSHEDQRHDHDHGCGTDELPKVHVDAPDQNFSPEGGGACGTGLCEAELGCDADFQFFQDWGSVAGAENRINSLINTMNIQYETEVDITHKITAIIVRTAEPDPYSASTLGGLLDQLRSEWLGNQSSIPHDVAELFTGRNLSGGVIGVAWVGAVCSSLRYSVVENIGSFGCATDLSAHELGHNWGAPHCSCSNNTMNSGLTCANDFSNSTINIITNFRDSIGCLSPACLPGPGSDCNNNGFADDCDIDSGASDDFNNNGVPDECESAVTLFVDAAASCPGTGDPGDPFCDIQTAILGSKSGDVIVLEDGVYSGAGNKDLDFGGREITLRSANGPANCVIDASGGLTAAGVVFDDGETSGAVLDGFTITNGHGANVGGGISILNNSSPTIRNCNVTGNSANVSGGGIYISGGSPTIVNTTVSDNTVGGFLAGMGGGISVLSASPTFRNVTVAGNDAAGGITGTPNGGGFHFENSGSSTISNAVVWGNTTAGTEPSISVTGIDPTVTDSDIEGGFPGGTAILDVDPSFVGGGDYHLMSGSAVIDQGDSALIPGGELDIDGDPRIVGPDVDMGSDEFSNLIVCQPDLGFGGPGSSVLSVCGDALGTGGDANVLLTGAGAFVDAFFVIGAFNAPTPFKGGTLVPLPFIVALPLVTDGSGEIVFPLSGGGGPFSLYAQYVIKPTPTTWEFSNAVELEFLP